MSDFIIACPSSVCASLWFILVAELLEEATLSGRLCERKDDGIAWSGDPWQLRVGMTELGTTGAGEPQIAGVPRVHQFLKLDGRGTTGDNIHLGQTRVWLPWNSPTDTTSKDPRQYGGERLFPHWTKSWLGWRPACWTPAKAKSKNRPM